MGSPSAEASFAQHLCSRIFERNDYGTPAALIAAINTAIAISPETNWKDRKAAFNAIAEKAPMRSDTGYLLKYEEVPDFVDAETKALAASFAVTPDRDKSSLLVTYISADGNIGTNVITRKNGALDNPPCDWGEHYPEAETQSVVMLLQAGDGRIIDRAMIDADTWRDIEDLHGSSEFFECVFESDSIQEAVDNARALTPTA